MQFVLISTFYFTWSKICMPSNN